MKKKLLVIMMLVPSIVMGSTCDVIKDTQTNINRNLVCDANNRTVTSFSYTSNAIGSISDDNLSNITEKYEFNYTGNVQKFIAPKDGYYQLEVWGAQGGNGTLDRKMTYEGGYGGYSRGVIYLKANEIIYIYVGGKGEEDMESSSDNDGNESGTGGGGATHISKIAGLLSSYTNASALNNLLIVAGGGGNKDIAGNGHEGSSGYGGSGYIGNNLLTNKVMYCYKCNASSLENTKTISTTNASSSAISNYAKKGNGYARISFVKPNKASIDNSVCKITCTENVTFSIDPIKKVLAGTGFSYPLYVSGERKCKAEYNYQTYEAKIKQLTNEYASLTGTAKTTKGNEIANLVEQKKKCDNFGVKNSEQQNVYKHNGNVSLKVETSTSEVNVPYVYEELDEYSNTLILDEVNYSSCDYNETKKTCEIGTKTIAGWTETARIYGKYTMNDSYLEKYTGDIKTTSIDNTCNAGDKYFTDFKEVTRPEENDTTDKGYKLTLIANNLGNNLNTLGDSWSLNVDCWYQVKNLVFPQNNLGGSKDENYDDYGGVAFQYRMIDLENPFPGREPNANWKGHENIIYSTKNDLSTLQRFVITLNRSSIKKVREYNDFHKYDTFNLNEMEKSKFIESNTNIIKRK